MRDPNLPRNALPAPCSVWFGPNVSDHEEREFIDFLVTKHGVGVCSWPRDASRIEHLANAGVPRLVFVARDSTPPPAAEDQISIRRPASLEAIHAALALLCAPRAAGRPSSN